MVEETDFENRRISNFQRHVTLTLDQATWHTIVHHSSTFTYAQNFIRIGAFCEWTDGRKYRRLYGSRLALLGQLGGIDLERAQLCLHL